MKVICIALFILINCNADSEIGTNFYLHKSQEMFDITFIGKLLRGNTKKNYLHFFSKLCGCTHHVSYTILV